MNVYTVKKNGVVVGSGTYQTKELLEMDYPSPEYELIYGEMQSMPEYLENYADQRRKAYPPLSDLADALYWQTQGDNSKMEAYMAKVEEVKNNIPKPS